MATNPPITIGPFANVPAPGSGVKSDWAQQITNYVVPTAWTTLALNAPWTNIGGQNPATLEYRRIGALVELHGMIKGGTAANPIATLPVGFRPVRGQLFWATDASGAFGSYYITTAGIINASTGAFTSSLAINAIFGCT